MTVHYISIILLYPLVYKFFNTLKRVKYLKHSYMFRHYQCHRQGVRCCLAKITVYIIVRVLLSLCYSCVVTYR